MERLTTQQFVELMERLAGAWSRRDTRTALDCFTPDAVYMEPPDVQFYQGHEQLHPYFEAIKPGTFMTFHHLWFDEESQSGAGEFSFGVEGQEIVDHGIAVAELRDGKISFWREYLHKGPADFEDFIAAKGKDWQWHIENYP